MLTKFCFYVIMELVIINNFSKAMMEVAHMSFLSNLFGNSKTTQQPEEKRDETIEQLFQNSSANLERHVVNLKKESGIDLAKHKAYVFILFDRSYSMYNTYYSGTVQKILTILFPLAVRFDDNGEMEVIVFNSSTNRIESMSLENYMQYVEKEMLNKNYEPSGGTAYVPAIQEAINMCLKNADPSFGIFLTDGAAKEKRSELDKVFKQVAETKKIFLSTIGFKTEDTSSKDFDYLRGLQGKFSNINFFEADDFDNLNSDDLFKKLLNGYPEWLQANGYI